MLQYRIHTHPEFLVVHLNGLVSLPAWQETLRELEVALEPIATTRLVINMMEVVGYLGIPERRAVGALMATHLRKMAKVAIVVQADKITDVVREETRRHGLELRLFSTHEDAVRWVTAE
jgi:hypothetical protein